MRATPLRMFSGLRHLLTIAPIAGVALLPGCATPDREMGGAATTPLELYARLADTGALARLCDERSPDIVTSAWSRRYSQREGAIETRLESIYGKEALQSAQDISVHGCWEGKISQLYQKQYDALLSRIEAQLQQ
jgi:hypothetical protein